MQIAIISDSHDNWLNIEKTIKYLNKQKIRIIIHCGDVCSPLILGKIAQTFKGEQIHLAKGNVDGDIEGFKNMVKKFPQIIYHGNAGKIEIEGLKITFCHFPTLAKKMAASQKYDFVFYGHTHLPWQEKINKTNLINPGTLAGLFTKATFAIFDTKTQEADLILLEKIN